MACEECGQEPCECESEEEDIVEEESAEENSE